MQLNLDRNRELFRSFVLFDSGAEQSLAKTKSAKKIKSNHTRTSSFKSPSSTKFRSSGLQHTLDTFLSTKKHSLKRLVPRKENPDESRSKQNTVKTKSRLRQVGDIADITSRIVKMAGNESDRDKFEGEILHMFYNFGDSNIVIAKAEMLTILKYIFGFFGRSMPRKRTQTTQTDGPDIESYKKTAKRLIVNNDMKPPADPFENNLVLLLQKEILLDEILTILNEEDIDLNNLLSITLERIEANFYEPPADASIDDGVSLTLEDKMKMPTPKAKWADPTVKNKLMIDLSKIDLQDSDTGRKEKSKGQKLSGKLDLQNIKHIREVVKSKQANGHEQQKPSVKNKEIPARNQANAEASFLSSVNAEEHQSRESGPKKPDKKKRMEEIFARTQNPGYEGWSA